MLRRALVVTAVAVALSAAGAFAFAPGLARAGHGWSLTGLWTGRGFTPAPPARDPLKTSDDLVLDNQGGAPGSYCPIRPRDPNASTVSQDDRTLSGPALDSATSAATPAKTDLLLPAPAASCATPVPSAPVSRSTLP